MCSVISEIDRLAVLLIPEDKICVIDDMVSEITINKNYDTGPLWALDSSLDDIAEFQHRAFSKLEDYPDDMIAINTPLQYARDEIEICNVSYSARYVVIYSIMHLEGVIRHMLKRHCTMGKLRFSNAAIDKSVYRLKALAVLPDDLLEGCFIFMELYNKIKLPSKQCVSFSERDALIAYVASRILALRVLAYS